LVGAGLMAGALVLFHYRDMSTIDPWYMLMLVGGASGISFLVGYVAGYLPDMRKDPSSEDRE